MLLADSAMAPGTADDRSPRRPSCPESGRVAGDGISPTVSGRFGTYPLAAKAGVAMARPGRAASAFAAAGEIHDQPHKASAQARPRREEVQEVDRPHVRDA